MVAKACFCSGVVEGVDGLADGLDGGFQVLIGSLTDLLGVALAELLGLVGGEVLAGDFGGEDGG